jgi:hypothetical protein
MTLNNQPIIGATWVYGGHGGLKFLIMRGVQCHRAVWSLEPPQPLRAPVKFSSGSKMAAVVAAAMSKMAVVAADVIP